MADDNSRSDFDKAIALQDSRVENVIRESLGDAERPSWLPDKFRDGEALVESYSQAERKIHEQSRELAQLRELVADYESQSNAAPLPEVDSSYGWDDEGYETFEQPQPFEGRTHQDLIQQALATPAAQQAVQAALQNPDMRSMAQNAIAAGLNQEREATVVDEGWRLAIEARPEIADKAGEIAKVIADDPSMAAAVGAGSALAVAGAIGQAYHLVQTHEWQPEISRMRKLRAQTASGSLGRPELSGPSRWDEIKGATGGKLDFS